MPGLAAGATYPHDLQMTRRHDRLWLIAALAFGLLVLPWLVYATGRTLMGPYAGGGAAAFFAAFLGDLLTFRLHAWVLALGPLMILTCWVAVWRITAPRQ
jgi:hypothetical protein